MEVQKLRERQALYRFNVVRRKGYVPEYLIGSYGFVLVNVANFARRGRCAGCQKLQKRRFSAAVAAHNGIVLVLGKLVVYPPKNPILVKAQTCVF